MINKKVRHGMVMSLPYIILQEHKMSMLAHALSTQEGANEFTIEDCNQMTWPYGRKQY